MSRLNKDLLLVGSVPLDTVEDVFRSCGGALGRYLPCLPDGEVGDRIWWHNYLAYRFYHGHPSIETRQRPAPIDGVPQWKPQSLQDMWLFKVKPGVSAIEFEDLGYGDAAIASYGVFRKLRDQGVFPSDVRFQICLPLTGSGLDTFFHDPADGPIMRPAYEKGIVREIEKIVAKIPPRELAFQWDVCVEVLDLEGRLPWTQAEGRWDRNVSPIDRLSRAIPEEAALVYHWCYGTLGEWPMTRPDDLSLCVKLSNYAAEHSGRRVDAVHMPVPRHPEDAYFAPLRDLAIGDTTLYLGLIHDTDDTAATRHLVEMARKHRAKFGIASVCGYGRRPADEVPRVIEAHRLAAEDLARR